MSCPVPFQCYGGLKQWNRKNSYRAGWSAEQMKKLKNTAAALTAAVMSAVISVAANAEGGLAASKAVTGTKALLNDISNILLVVAPLVGTACIVYFAVRHGAAEEMDQKKWKQRMIVAAVSVVVAVVASALINVLVGYYQ